MLQVLFSGVEKSRLVTSPTGFMLHRCDGRHRKPCTVGLQSSRINSTLFCASWFDKYFVSMFVRGFQTGVHVPLVVHLLMWRGTFNVNKWREKCLYMNSFQIMYTYEFVRTVHVTNGVKQGRVLSPYLLAVFLMIYFLN